MVQSQDRDLADNGPVKATVGLVRGEGSCRYAVAYPDQGEDITFSLTDWQGTSEPRKGQVVLLERVELFAKGWRALSARPVTYQSQEVRREEKRKERR